MGMFRRILAPGTALFLAASALLAPVSASELSDAEQEYFKLKVKYDEIVGNLLLVLPGLESEARACVATLKNQGDPAEVAARTACEQNLISLETERLTNMKIANELKLELVDLEIKIETLKASTGTTQNSGGTNSAGTATSSSGSQSTSEPNVNASAQTSMSPSPLVTNDDSSNQNQEISPSVTQSSSTSRTGAGTSPTVSQTPAPSVKSSVSPSPKPAAKKRTITCVKGKTIKKVTAVKPVCPKGFKLKKK